MLNNERQIVHYRSLIILRNVGIGILEESLKPFTPRENVMLYSRPDNSFMNCGKSSHTRFFNKNHLIYLSEARS